LYVVTFSFAALYGRLTAIGFDRCPQLSCYLLGFQAAFKNHFETSNTAFSIDYAAATFEEWQKRPVEIRTPKRRIR
jgi:hypothetical protein